MDNISKATLKAVRHNIYALTGKGNIEFRQHILTDIIGLKIPKAKAGINRLETELLHLSGLTNKGNCTADRHNLLATWIKNL